MLHWSSTVNVVIWGLGLSLVSNDLHDPCVLNLTNEKQKVICCSVPLNCCHSQAEDSERREKNLEEAKKVTIENDPSLPEPKTVSQETFRPIHYPMHKLLLWSTTGKQCQSHPSWPLTLSPLSGRLKSGVWNLCEASVWRCLAGFTDCVGKVRAKCICAEFVVMDDVSVLHLLHILGFRHERREGESTCYDN